MARGVAFLLSSTCVPLEPFTYHSGSTTTILVDSIEGLISELTDLVEVIMHISAASSSIPAEPHKGASELRNGGGFVGKEAHGRGHSGGRNTMY